MNKEELTLLGKVSGQVELIIKRQDTVIGDIVNLFKGQIEIKTSLAELHCDDDNRRLKLLEAIVPPLKEVVAEVKSWKDTCLIREEGDKAMEQAVNIERRKFPLTLRHAVYIALISASCSGIIAIGVAFITHYWR